MLADEIQRQQGSGQKLDPVAQAALEPAIGIGLNHITVHDDGGADMLARSVAAEAFTTGKDIYFRSGAYAPKTEKGLRLLAHEVAHTKQQGKGDVRGTPTAPGLEVVEPDHPLEQEANRSADHVMGQIQRASVAGRQLVDETERMTTKQPGIIQRQPVPFPPGFPPIPGIPGGNIPGLPIPNIPSIPGLPGLPQPQPPGPQPGAPSGGATCANPLAGAPPGTKVDSGANTLGWGGPASFVRFIPRAEHQVGGALVDIRHFTAANPETLLIQPGSNGMVTLIVDIDWCQDNGAGGSGPGPSGNTNPLCSLPVPPPGMSPQIFNQLCKAGDDPGAIIDAMSGPALCGILTVLVPPAGAACFGAMLASGIIGLFTGFDPLEKFREWLKKVLGVPGGTPGGGLPASQPASTGRAQAIFHTSYSFSEEGNFELFGPPAVGMTQGAGAELISPVQTSRETLSRGGAVSIVPHVRSSGTQAVGGVTQPVVHSWQHIWAANLQLPPVPRKPFQCSTAVKPFHIGSDKLMNPETEDFKLFQWYKSLAPAINRRIESGELEIRVIGRASTTGSFVFNREISRKRAQRVREILHDFAGANANINTFGLGEYEAPDPPNVENAGERRADVEVKGELVGDDAAATPDECICPGIPLPHCPVHT